MNEEGSNWSSGRVYHGGRLARPTVESPDNRSYGPSVLEMVGAQSVLKVLLGPLSESSELGDAALSRYVCPGNWGATGVSAGLSSGASSGVFSAILRDLALAKWCGKN